MTHAVSNIVDLITTQQDRKFEPVARMASAIVEMYQMQGDCLKSDLQLFDFTEQQIIADWHLALAIAHVEMRLCDHARATSREVAYA